MHNSEQARPKRVSKRISVSSKRQISIPKEFYDFLGIGHEVTIELKDNQLIIKPVHPEPSADFAQLILQDLVKEGFEGEELLKEFSYRQSQIRPALTKMIEEEQPKAKVYTAETLDALFDGDEGE